MIFVGLTPVDERVDPVPWRPEISYKMKFIKEYNSILKTVCDQHGIQLIEVMEKLSDTKSLLSDGLHPNTKGHESIYNEVINYLKGRRYI